MCVIGTKVGQGHPNNWCAMILSDL